MIRQAVAADASRIAEILIFAKRTAYRSIFHDDRFSFGEMQVLPLAMQYLEHPDKLKNVMVFEDEFVKGMASVSVQENADGARFTEIDQLYIDPFFQHQKIGGRLIDEIQRQSLATGLDLICLWVLEKNQSARNFYESKGFAATGVSKLVEDTAEYVLRYSKPLGG